MAHPALGFLQSLDPLSQARFNIETYTDKKEKPKPDPLHHRFPELPRPKRVGRRAIRWAALESKDWLKSRPMGGSWREAQ